MRKKNASFDGVSLIFIPCSYLDGFERFFMLISLIAVGKMRDQDETATVYGDHLCSDVVYCI